MSGRNTKPKNKFLNFMFATKSRNEECNSMSMPQLQAYCANLWESMSDEAKAAYKLGGNSLEKSDKAPPGNYFTGEGCKYDTLGRPMESVRKMRQDRSDRIEAGRKFIAEEIREIGSRSLLAKTHFFLADVQSWVKTVEGRVVPAEIAIVKVNVEDGVVNKFHRLIDPGQLPIGYASTAHKFIEEKFHLDLFDKDSRELMCKNYKELYKDIVKFIGGHYKGMSGVSVILKQDSYNPVYYLPPTQTVEKYEKNDLEKAFDWIAEKAGAETELIPVLNLAELFYQIHSRLNKSDKPILSSKLMASFWLEQDKWIYQSGMRCDNHEKLDMDNSNCSMSKITIQSFIFADLCNKYMANNNTLVAGRHYPAETEESLSICEDEKATTEYAESSVDDYDFKSLNNQSLISVTNSESTVSKYNSNSWKKNLLGGRSTPNPSQSYTPLSSRPVTPTPVTPTVDLRLHRKLAQIKLMNVTKSD